LEYSEEWSEAKVSPSVVCRNAKFNGDNAVKCCQEINEHS